MITTALLGCAALICVLGFGAAALLLGAAALMAAAGEGADPYDSEAADLAALPQSLSIDRRTRD